MAEDRLKWKLCKSFSQFNVRVFESTLWCFCACKSVLVNLLVNSLLERVSWLEGNQETPPSALGFNFHSHGKPRQHCIKSSESMKPMSSISKIEENPKSKK